MVGRNSDGELSLGIFAEIPYDGGEILLPPRARILIDSDGLTDALAPGGGDYALFGVEGIDLALKESRSKSLDEAMEHLFNFSRSFTGRAGGHDDASVVLIERT